MGALIMTHSDDNGLVLPPKLAPTQVVIVPIYKGEEQLNQLNTHVEGLLKELRSKGVSVKYDNRDTHKPGFKFNEYELKGIPLRIAIGPRDLENETYELARRDTLTKQTVAAEGIGDLIVKLLDEIQENLWSNALNYRSENITEVDDYKTFKEVLDQKGGFVSAHWDGTSATEDLIKEETKATIRCIPIDQKSEKGRCIYSGNPSKGRVLFAKAY
jgi:prolyl-tRNA synthetase